MRRSNEWRVYGPQKHGRKWRLQYVRGSRATREVAYESFDTLAEAERGLAAARDEAQGVTVRMAVDMFLERIRARGRAASTIENYEHRLWRLLGLPGNENRSLRYVQHRGAELYAASVRGASDTHINGLGVGRMWGAFCVKERLLKVNPFADVEALGQRRHGSSKPRLTVNESRRLEAFCITHGHNPDCVLTYGYLMLGKRASELVGVAARDLDDDGWLLRIAKAKTTASVKPVGVPPELRAMLLGLAEGLPPEARLFVNQSGEPMTRHVAWARVRKILKAAGVPELPPQALRRTFTDNASLQGISLHSIAQMTGHASPAVTRRSYMAPEQFDAAQVQRNLMVLKGGRS